MSLKIFKTVKRVVSVNGEILPAGSMTPSGAGNNVTVQEDPASSISEYTSNLIKLIPGEVMVSYPTLLFLANQLPIRDYKESISGALAVLLTFILRWFPLSNEVRPQKGAIFISALACIIWIYQQRGFIFFEVSEDWYPAVLMVLILFTIIAPRISPKEKVYI